MAGSLSEAEQGDYAKDGSVDLKGRPVLRSKKGGWAACYFVVGESKNIVFYLQNSMLIYSLLILLGWFAVYEVFERMAYYGISLGPLMRFKRPCAKSEYMILLYILIEVSINIYLNL